MENQDDLPPSLTIRRESQDIPNLAMKKGNQGNLSGHPQFPRFHQEIDHCPLIRPAFFGPAISWGEEVSCVETEVVTNTHELGQKPE